MAAQLLPEPEREWHGRKKRPVAAGPAGCGRSGLVALTVILLNDRPASKDTARYRPVISVSVTGAGPTSMGGGEERL